MASVGMCFLSAGALMLCCSKSFPHPDSVGNLEVMADIYITTKHVERQDKESLMHIFKPLKDTEGICDFSRVFQ